MERFYGGAACWCASNDVRSIGAPPKVVRSYVMMRVEQSDYTAGKRIAG
jgi:hypothetical protein